MRGNGSIQFIAVFEDGETAQDLGHLVIGKGGEQVHVVELTESAAVEGSVQISNQDLGALVEADFLALVGCNVVEAGEAADHFLDQFDG